MTTTELMPRTAIDEIVAHRTAALAGVAAAYDTLTEALKHMGSAAPGQIYEAPSIRMDSKQWKQTKDEVLLQSRHALDRGIWRHLISTTQFDQLMDRTAREQFREQLEKDPPEITVETAMATMGQLYEDRDLIFRRGVATTFARLDRRFKTHDGFKIGSRIILTYAFNDGHWSYGGHQADTIVDLERAFCILDGRPPIAREEGLVGAYDRERANHPRSFSNFAARVESEFFRMDACKNGNAHLWFKREDLVRKVNQLLADYYGKGLGAGYEAAQRDRVYEPIRTPAKNFGFWETPERVAAELLHLADIYIPREDDHWGRQRAAEATPFTVLEPSAGKGALARLIKKAPGAVLTCVEIQPHLCSHLEAQHLGRVIQGDFHDQRPGVLGTFDRIVMNPPFDGTRDVDHVRHALKFLAPGGTLVSVMASGVEFREDKKTVAFRELVQRMGGRFHDLPPESFRDSGTRVNTCIVKVTNRGVR